MKGGKTVLNELPTLTVCQFPFIHSLLFYWQEKRSHFLCHQIHMAWLSERRKGDLEERKRATSR